MIPTSGGEPDNSGIAAYHRDDRVTGIVALNQPQRLRAHRHLLDGAVPTTTPGGDRR